MPLHLILLGIQFRVRKLVLLMYFYNIGPVLKTLICEWKPGNKFGDVMSADEESTGMKAAILRNRKRQRSVHKLNENKTLCQQQYRSPITKTNTVLDTADAEMLALFI